MAGESTHTGMNGAAEVFVTQRNELESDFDDASSIVVSQIMVDLTGLASSANGDIIGNPSGGVAYLTQVTTSDQGTIFGVTMECFEDPASGSATIGLHSASENTGTEDDPISGLTSDVCITAVAQSVGVRKANDTGKTALATKYLYLVSGASGNATYTAGRLLITIYGSRNG